MSTERSGATSGTCAETEITPVESSGNVTSRPATTSSAVKAMAMGQRLRLRADGADSSNVSRNMVSSIMQGFDTAQQRQCSGKGVNQTKINRPPRRAAGDKGRNNYGFFGVAAAGAGAAGRVVAGRGVAAGAVAPPALAGGTAAGFAVLYASTRSLVMLVPSLA